MHSDTGRVIEEIRSDAIDPLKSTHTKDRLPDGYQRLDGLATSLQWLFAGWLALAAAGIALRALERTLINRLASDPSSVSQAQITASDDRIETFGIVVLVALIATGIVFIVWFHRAYRNLDRLGVDGRYSTGWAVGGWFVPFASLWIPKKIANDMWTGSEPDPDAPTPGVPGVVNAWWAAWIVIGAVGWYSWRSSDANLSDARNDNFVEIVYFALLIVAAILAALVVRRLSARIAVRAAITREAVTTFDAPLAAGTDAGREPAAVVRSRWASPRVIASAGVAVAVVVGATVFVAGRTSSTDSTTVDGSPGEAPSRDAPTVPAPPGESQVVEEAGLSLVVPEGWVAQPQPSKSEVEAFLEANPDVELTAEQLLASNLFTVAYDPDGDGVNDAGITVTLEPIPRPTEAQFLDRSALTDVREGAASGGLEDVHVTRADLPVGPAIQVVGQVPVNDPVLGEYTQEQIQYLFLTSRGLISVTLAAVPDLDVADSFDQVMQSVRLRA